MLEYPVLSNIVISVSPILTSGPFAPVYPLILMSERMITSFTICAEPSFTSGPLTNISHFSRMQCFMAFIIADIKGLEFTPGPIAPVVSALKLMDNHFMTDQITGIPKQLMTALEMTFELWLSAV